MPPPRTSWIRPILVLLILAALLGLLHLYGAPVLSRQGLQRLDEGLRRLGGWGPVVYVLLFLPVGVAGLPVTPLILLGGLFGVIAGTGYATLGATLGAAAAFLAARHGLRGWIERRVGAHPLFEKINRGVRETGWHMLLITRWVPVFPYNLQNYAYGLTRMKLGTFTLVSGLALLPVVGAYVCIGGALISGRGDPKRMLGYVLAALAGFALLSLLPRLLRRRWHLERVTGIEPV